MVVLAGGKGKGQCAWLDCDSDSGSVVHVLVEGVVTVDESVFEDGKVELVGGMCVVGKCGKGVVCAVMSDVGSDVTSSL